MTPLGITIHYLGSHNVEAAIKHLRSKDLSYHVIVDRGGFCHHMAEFTSQVNHAGVASWRGKSPNRSHIAISLASWGELKFESKKLKTWAGALYPPEAAAYREGNLGLAKTWWDAATDAQLDALDSLVLKLVREYKIDPENICGHDECALPHGRKSDPGGVLPFTMSSFRDRIKSRLTTV